MRAAVAQQQRHQYTMSLVAAFVAKAGNGADLYPLLRAVFCGYCNDPYCQRWVIVLLLFCVEVEIMLTKFIDGCQT